MRKQREQYISDAVSPDGSRQQYEVENLPLI